MSLDIELPFLFSMLFREMFIFHLIHVFAGVVKMVEEWKDRITVDPAVLTGKPIIKGTRIAVEFILDLLANGWTTESILKNYPQLKQEDIFAVLKYATEILTEEKVYPLP